MDNMNLENKEELQQKLETLRAKDGFICDMDGVIYHGNRLLPGVKEFVDWLYRENKHFLFLTNSSERSPKELQQKLGRMGLDVDESHWPRRGSSARRRPDAAHMSLAARGLSWRFTTRASQ